MLMPQKMQCFIESNFKSLIWLQITNWILSTNKGGLVIIITCSGKLFDFRPGVNVMKPFYSLMMWLQNKLERLSLESVYASLIFASMA
jgi:hypothetical protein